MRVFASEWQQLLEISHGVQHNTVGFFFFSVSSRRPLKMNRRLQMFKIQLKQLMILYQEYIPVNLSRVRD